MNKALLLILAVFFIIICVISLQLINIKSEKQEVKRYNKTYEEYLDKEIKGTDVATIIGKVVNQNEKNNVKKDEKGYYINNQNDSIQIDLKMITVKKTYPMEEIYNSKIATFVQHFDNIRFKCTKIEYHKATGKVSKLIFEELQ
jgi:ABC-type Na+ efflux pump permease subunit